VRLLLLIPSLLVACGGPAPSPPAATKPSSEDGSQPPSPRPSSRAAPDPAPGACDDAHLAWCGPASRTATAVRWRQDPQARWQCPDFQLCVGDYLRLLDRARPWARPRSPEALHATFRAIEDNGIHPLDPAAPLPAPELRRRIEDGLGLGFLLDGLRARELDAVEVRTVPGDGFREHELLLTDPWVGTFPALLLLPTSPGPHPAILGVPGHSDTPWTFADAQFGRLLASRGHAVLVILLRGNGSDLWEDFTARRFLLDGFSFMTVRVYETLLGLKVLQSRTDIDAQRIALMGHSGGSVSNHLALRLSPGFAGGIFDLSSTWNGRMEGDVLLDEVSPELYVLKDLLNDLRTAAVPTLEEPYGYPRGPGPVLEFLRTLPPIAPGPGK
jgi:hypothetical protein